MDTGLKLGFDWLERDRLCTTVKVYNDGRVEVQNFTDVIIDTVFGVKTNINEYDVLDFIEDRCFPRTRGNAKELLSDIGLRGYNPLRISRVTHGQLCGDDFWIRYRDEPNLRYEDVKIDYNVPFEMREVDVINS